jgi:hypothetical protein
MGGKKTSPCRSARITFLNCNGIILLECNELEPREKEPFIVDDSTLPGKGKKTVMGSQGNCVNCSIRNYMQR